MVRVLSQDLDAAPGWLQQPQDQAHSGGLAGPIVAEQPQHLALFQVQAEVPQHLGLAIMLLDAFQLYCVHDLLPTACPALAGDGAFISGKLSCTPGDLITGKARWTQRSNSMAGLFINRRTSG